MAKAKKEKKSVRPKIKTEDNPSLNKVGGKLCLRVFEDFYIEDGLPKWQVFKANKTALLKEVKMIYLDDKSRLDEYLDKHKEEADGIKKRVEELKEMEKALADDKWGIQSRHETEVAESLSKMAVFYGRRPNTFLGKVSAFASKVFGNKEKLVPVEVAFADLKDHMELTSSAELAMAKAAVDALVERYIRSGQYSKAETARKLLPQIAHELAIASCGYTKFVTERQMIDFVTKSERGVRVEFLRYYDGEMPEDVIRKKSEADGKMIFDNYVVAYYGDFVKEAKKEVAKKAEAKKEAATRIRRDPILFGVVKQTRKLYYICDWETPEDDLTLEKLEKELGISAETLFNPKDDDKGRASAIERMSAEEDRAIMQAVNRNLSDNTYSSNEGYSVFANGSYYVVNGSKD